jgi:alkylation response protein AidB-like acyl-CoA dehydrogenase
MSNASVPSNEERQLILRTVRDFVERDVIPVASGMEHRGEYPFALADEMARIGLFGLNTPETLGGSDVDYVTFARIFAELARGWLGLAGIVGTHLVLCDVMVRYATDEQKRRFLPGRPARDAVESVYPSRTPGRTCRTSRLQRLAMATCTASTDPKCG